MVAEVFRDIPGKTAPQGRPDISVGDSELDMYFKDLLRHPLLLPQQEQLLFSIGQIKVPPKLRIEPHIVSRDGIPTKGLKQKPEFQQFLSLFRPDDQARSLELLTRSDTLSDYIVAHHMRLVGKLAYSYNGKGVPLPELFQEGSIGLAKAVNSFDIHRTGPKKAVFLTYATEVVKNSMIRAIRDTWSQNGLPYHIAHAAKTFRRICESLHDELGRPPTISETRRHLQGLNLFAPEITEFLLFRSESTKDPLSLDKSLPNDEDESRLIDTIADEKEDTERLGLQNLGVDRAVLGKVLSSISPRRVQILMLRQGLVDGEHWTLERIAQDMGITRERVRQLETAAIKDVRKQLQGLGIEAERLFGDKPKIALAPSGHKSLNTEARDHAREKREAKIRTLRNRGYWNHEIAELLELTPNQVGHTAGTLLARGEIRRIPMQRAALRKTIDDLTSQGKSDLEIAMNQNKNVTTIRLARNEVRRREASDHSHIVFLAPEPLAETGD